MSDEVRVSSKTKERLMALKLGLSFVSFFLTVAQAQANVLKLTAGSKKIENVAIAQTAVLSLNKQDISLDLIGAGLRSKRVLIANVKVYVAQLFSSDAAQFVRTEKGALDSLRDCRTTVMSLTFLRNVDAPTVQQSFKEALTKNSINLTEPAMAAFLQAVVNGGDAVSGKTLVFAFQKNADGSETATYEDSNGHLTSVPGPAGTSRKLLAMWLGEPSDSGLASLKNDLVKGL